MELLFCLVGLLACVVGKICGMGGGVIIKPVLDAFGILSVEAINFYSACTVTAMSGYSVVKSLKSSERQLDLRISTPLAVGAAIGGFAGKALFSRVAVLFADPNTAGGVQAALLFLLTLLYTVKKNAVKGWRIKNSLGCVLIGLMLGSLGAFLGIGGGPFNMAALYLCFSMSTKQAAENSLYIILLSQITGLFKTVLPASVPTFVPLLLLGMILCGILGSEGGRRLNTRLNEKTATHLLEIAMLFVMSISVYNFCKYLF